MGDDGTFWGGEVLVATLATYRRVARFGRASMPGGALAVKKPYRMALGYLLSAESFEDDGAGKGAGAGAAIGPSAGAGGPGAFGWLDPELTRAFRDRLDPREIEVVRIQLARGLNSPVASSAGRLYDAAASLIGIRDVAEYEAQAAIELELLAAEGNHDPLPFRLVRRDSGDGKSILVYDPRPTLQAILVGKAAGEPTHRLAARFQETVAAVTREIVGAVAATTGLRTVALSGGVFQNQWLSTTLVRRLSGDGFEVHTNSKVPANDGGIAYGQAAVAAARLAEAAR
jgi:hydrogenase maturation protein HypF